MANPTVLEQEIEHLREDLASSIDQLVYRTNPKVIARRQWAKVKGLFVDAETGQVNVKAVGAAGIGAAVVVGGLILLRALRD